MDAKRPGPIGLSGSALGAGFEAKLSRQKGSTMSSLLPRFATFLLALVSSIITALPVFAQAVKPLKVFMTTDMEGVAGVFDADLQCDPWKSPRWEESHKLLTGEVNAAVSGLFEGGATDVDVYDGHDSGRSLSVLDIE